MQATGTSPSALGRSCYASGRLITTVTKRQSRHVTVELRLYIYRRLLILTLGVAGDTAPINCWIYDSLPKAIGELTLWNPLDELEPKGWILHPGTGRTGSKPNETDLRDHE